MIDDPIDDYLQALIGEALPADAGTTATSSPQPAEAAPQADSSTPTAAGTATAGSGDALLDELDAAFDQARAIYETTQAGSTPPGSGDALLDELDAAFDQARAIYETTQAGSAPAGNGDALLDELDAAFDQARAIYETTQAGSTPAGSSDALLDELDAAFDQARAVYETTQAGSTPPGSGDALLDELDAAFDQARADYQSGQATAAQAAPRPASPARRIPPAPLGPPVLAARTPPAVPVWQAAAAGNAPGSHEPRRRASERSSRWLRLRCGQQPYALELLKVQEVVLLAPLLSLRGTAPHMLGIMNLRGQVVPVMDLGLYLGGEPAAEDTTTRIVVLESEGQSLGLRVSAVDDVASLSESQIEPPDTARLCRFSNHLFRGVARLGGPPIILLDANALLN